MFHCANTNQASSCVFFFLNKQTINQSLTWMPKTWCTVSGFGQLFMVSALSHNANVWWSNMSWLNPLWSSFHVTCPRLYPNGGITPRRLACTSPEETVAIYNKLLVVIYADVAKITKRIFRRDWTAFSVEPRKPGQFSRRQRLCTDFSL